MYPKLKIILKHLLISCLIIALILPPAVIATTTPALAQSETLDEPAAEPGAIISSEETLTYTPTFDPIPEPSEETFTSVVEAAAETQAEVDSEANRPGIEPGVGAASLAATGVVTQIGNLPLTIELASDGSLVDLAVQAEILPADVAQQWTPSGLAFRLSVSADTSANVTASTLAAMQPLSLTLDYSNLPLRVGGSYLHRLMLYRVEGENWEALPTINDAAQRQLVAQITPQFQPVEATVSQPTTPAPDTQTLNHKHYLPLVTTPVGANQDEAIYVLAAAASGLEGSYKATPFTFARNYEVALATGSFQTNYAIPLPPAPAALAPAVALQYDSGSVDGMTTTKNNQPSWVGTGWTLEAGHITRHLKSCENTVSPGDLCLK